jgi:hypothetical protein
MKNLLILIGILFLLTGCVEPNPNLIQMTLNSSIDTIEVGSNYQDPGASARYGVLVLDVSTDQSMLDTSNVGVYEITYTATHKNFSKTIKRIVTVIDTTPPIITLNPGIDTIFEGETWIDEGVTVFDHSEGEIEVLVIGAVGHLSGVYEITYQASDIYGNQSSIKRFVYVITRPS